MTAVLSRILSDFEKKLFISEHYNENNHCTIRINNKKKINKCRNEIINHEEKKIITLYLFKRLHPEFKRHQF